MFLNLSIHILSFKAWPTGWETLIQLTHFLLWPCLSRGPELCFGLLIILILVLLLIVLSLISTLLCLCPCSTLCLNRRPFLFILDEDLILQVLVSRAHTKQYNTDSHKNIPKGKLIIKHTFIPHTQSPHTHQSNKPPCPHILNLGTQTSNLSLCTNHRLSECQKDAILKSPSVAACRQPGMLGIKSRSAESLTHATFHNSGSNWFTTLYGFLTFNVVNPFNLWHTMLLMSKYTKKLSIRRQVGGVGGISKLCRRWLQPRVSHMQHGDCNCKRESTRKTLYC